MAGVAVNNSCLQHIQAAIELADHMIAMADDIVKDCEDDGTLVILSVIRDSAYKIKQTAEREYKVAEHEQKH